MSEALRFSIVGGDARQANLAELFSKDGHAVSTFALETAADYGTDSLAQCMQGADCVVLPIPIVRDEGVLNAPTRRHPPTIEDIWQTAAVGQVLVGGRIPTSLMAWGAKMGLCVVDILQREDFAVRNAIPTAEGALSIAMEHMKRTLHGARCLILGYGRIGRVLAAHLIHLGANVTVSARSQENFAWLSVAGIRSLHTERLSGHLGAFDLIVNTVPALVLPKTLLEEVPVACLCIDLASTPGGIDFDAAHALGIRCVWALGLPGKVAPITASVILKDTIYHIIQERKKQP